MRFCLALLLLFSPLFAEEYLYIIHAKSGSYDPDTKLLLLQDIDHSVTYFSDETPKRAGKTSLNSFLLELTGEHQEFNAGFIYYTDSRHHYSDLPVALSDPHYDFETSELSFKMRLTGEVEVPRMEIEEINLFIDDVPRRSA